MLYEIAVAVLRGSAMFVHGMGKQDSRLPFCFLRQLSKLILAEGLPGAAHAIPFLTQPSFLRLSSSQWFLYFASIIIVQEQGLLSSP
jgi:hypothetical protein